MPQDRRKSDEVLIRLDENVKSIKADMSHMVACYDALVSRVGEDEGKVGIIEANLITAGQEIKRLRDTSGVWSGINTFLAAIAGIIGYVR
jgi:hypothetical protein